MSTPTIEPVEARAGDTWKWTRTLDDYPAGTWELRYRFRHPTLPGFEIAATASGTDHAVNVAAATTAAYYAGSDSPSFSWVAWVTSGSEQYTVGTGTLRLLPDLRNDLVTAGRDTRSHARKMLEKVEAAIEALNLDAKAYVINGRSMTKRDLPELLKLRSQYQQEVNNEEQAARLGADANVGGRVQVRLYR